MSARRGQIAFSSSLVLAVFALGGAVAAFFVASSAALAVLGGSACVAFVALVFGFVSLRGDRFRRSLGAILASLLVLTGIGVAFAVTSVRGFLAAVEAAQGPQPVVDEEFQFRLTPPSDDAEMFGIDRATELHPRARAGFQVHGWSEEDLPDLEAAVFVEPSYGLSLEEAAALQLPRIADAEPSWRSEAIEAEVLDRPALRFRQQTATDGGAWWQEITFFTHADHLYALSARSHRLGTHPDGDPWYPSLEAAFSLLGGEIAYGEYHDPLTRSGAGWEVERGRFSSRVWGLTVDATDERWEMRAGHAACEREDGSLLTLTRRRPEVALRVVPLSVSGRSRAEVESSVLYPDDPALDAPPITLALAGQDVAFEAVRAHGEPPRVGRRGLWIDDTRALVFVVMGPTLAVADAELRELAPRVSVGPAEPDAPLSPWEYLEPDHWARGGALHLAYEPLRWRRPSSAWRACGLPGVPLAQLTPSRRAQLMWLEAPSLGLTGVVRVGDAPEPLLLAEPGDVVQVGGGRLLRSGPIEGRASGEWVATWVRQTQTDQLLVEIWGSARDVERHASEIEAAIAGLEVLDAPPFAGIDDDGVYRDARLGFEFAPPWPLDDVYVPNDDPGAVWLEAQEGAHLMALFAAPRRTERTVEAQAHDLLDDLYPRAPHFGRLREGPLGDCAGGEIVQRDAPMGLGGASLYRCVSDDVLFVLYVQRGPNGPDPQRIADGLTLSARAAQ